MKLERFLYLLDAYGADLRRWPEAYRQPAGDLLAHSAEAVQAQRVAARLDSALRSAAPIVTDEAVERVLDAVAEPCPEPDHGFYAAVVAGIGRRWIPPALLGGMALLGFVVGLVDIETESAASGMRSDVAAIVFNTDLAGTLGL